MKSLMILMFSVLFVLFTSAECLTGRGGDESDKQARQATERLQREGQSQVGMPNIQNFQEKKLMKKIVELRDDAKLVCHAYISTYTGVHYLGRCVGYGLPYSTQFTNPEKRIGDGINGEIATLPQAEANGLFMPEGLSATWITLLDSVNTPYVVYVESNLIVSPVPLNIEGDKSSI